jgi:hypothetical protein
MVFPKVKGVSWSAGKSRLETKGYGYGKTRFRLQGKSKGKTR